MPVISGENIRIDRVLRGITTTGDARELTVDGQLVNGNENGLELEDDSTYYFYILIVARRTDENNESAAYRIRGCADRNVGAASTANVGAFSTDIIAEDVGAWTVVATTSGTGRLSVLVGGEAGKTIEWKAYVKALAVQG